MATVKILLRRGLARGMEWRQSSALRVGRQGELAHDLKERSGMAIRRHAVPLAAGVALIVALPIGAALLHRAFRVDSFDSNASHAVDQRVAQLLQGEELVPPPSPPPDFFTTPEVEEGHPLARSASRQWALLDDTFGQRLLLAFRLMHDRYGYDMVLIEGYRSPQRQAALAALGPSVTRAGAFESYHQFGLAADCAFLRDGRIVLSEKDPWAMSGYQHYGEVAKSLGMVWGGDWEGLRDLGHVELHRARVAAVDGEIRPAGIAQGR